MSLPDSLKRSIAERSVAAAESMAIGLAARCESPIEVYFAVAFVTVAEEYAGVSIGGPRDGATFWIDFQRKVGKYRADFAVGHAGNPNAIIIVECDGHDFHDRTKEQASRDRKRDRALQMSGHKVFRFTGSDLFRDACACAEEVVKALILLDYRSVE